MEHHFLLLQPNRVRRNYLGGYGIDELQGVRSPKDSDHPEEWIASLIEAKNPGLSSMKQEGLSSCFIDGHLVLLRDLINSNPSFYLGKLYYQQRGLDLGFLFKILDSSMRLHVQAHPTATFAKNELGSKYGKLECYCILKIRKGTKGYIRLGFQNPPDKEEWKRIIQEQDIEAMDSCFEPVPIEEGQIWYIPGGVPHAIGENVLMLEIMEPSDLVVRCEFERNGIIVPPEARFMQRGLDFCLSVFDYSKTKVEEAQARYRLHRTIVDAASNYTYEKLIGHDIASTFEVFCLQLRSGKYLLSCAKAQVLLVISGRVAIRYKNEILILQKGQEAFVAADSQYIEVSVLDSEVAELYFVCTYL